MEINLYNSTASIGEYIIRHKLKIHNINDLKNTAKRMYDDGYIFHFYSDMWNLIFKHTMLYIERQTMFIDEAIELIDARINSPSIAHFEFTSEGTLNELP